MEKNTRARSQETGTGTQTSALGCHLNGQLDLIIFAGTGDLFVTLWNKSYDEEANIPLHLDLGALSVLSILPW